MLVFNLFPDMIFFRFDQTLINGPSMKFMPRLHPVVRTLLPSGPIIRHCFILSLRIRSETTTVLKVLNVVTENVTVKLKEKYDNDFIKNGILI